MAFQLSFTIESDTRYLACLRRMVDAAADVVGDKHFPHRARRAVSMALIEAVDNAIFHAHRRRRDLPIHIVLSANARAIRLGVGDCGAGINGVLTERPPETATHGRGLYLIRSLQSEVESVKENGLHWIRMTYWL